MNTFTIFHKELNSYFRSPIAYGVLTLFAALTGVFFFIFVQSFVQYSIQSAMTGQGGPISVNDVVVRNALGNYSVIGLFLIPMITMRLFAEEKRTGTIELLVTSPISDLEIILGKWLAAFALYAVMLGISALSMALLFLYGNPDWRPLVVGYLGLLLQGGCLLAIGTFISTCTRNQIVAGVAGFSVSLLLYIANWASDFGSTGVSQIIGYLSIQSHFESFSKGVLDSKDVIFYLSVMFVGLFLTARSLESLRWRS